MSNFGYEKAVPVICINCGKRVSGIRELNGVTKVKCPHCGTVMVSKAVSRRHIVCDVYAPEGQLLMQ